MPKEIRVWQVNPGDELREVPRKSLDLESRLEVWIEQDISVLSDDLLVIGRQVLTDYGDYIDLLCLDRSGDVVVVELKRDTTPREVTAQALDYASWVRDLSNESVTQIAEGYLSHQNSPALAAAFEDRFGESLPEVLNEDHSLLVVASVIDARSERIVRYLSDDHGVKINVVTFHFFKDGDGSEYLARVFLLEPEAVEQRSAKRGSSKRRSPPSFEEYEELAEKHGVSMLYNSLLSGLSKSLNAATGVTLVAFYGRLDGGWRALLGLYPAQSSKSEGLHFTIYFWRLARYLDIPTERIEESLPSDLEPWKYVSTSDQDGSGFAGYFTSDAEVEAFLRLFR